MAVTVRNQKQIQDPKPSHYETTISKRDNSQIQATSLNENH